MTFFRKCLMTVTAMTFAVLWLWYGLNSLKLASSQRYPASLRSPLQAGIVEIPVHVKGPEDRRNVEK